MWKSRKDNLLQAPGTQTLDFRSKSTISCECYIGEPWGILGIRPLSGFVVLAAESPLKIAHFAGESKTVEYSVGFISKIFSLSIIRLSLDMQ